MEKETKKCEQEFELYFELYEAQLLLSHLRDINDAINNYVMNASDEEIKSDFGNKINTFSDCIGMYAERLEQIIEKLNRNGELKNGT